MTPGMTHRLMRWRRAMAATVALLAWLRASPTFAETVPLRGLADSRVRTASYDGNEVYRLQGYVGYEIDLQFEAGESFVGIGAGDIEGLSFVSQDNHLFIKPKARKVGTNLTVITTRRPYQFAYTASFLRPEDGDADLVFAVRFSYPPGGSDRIAEDLSRLFEKSSASRSHNMDYAYCGSSVIKPTAAWDDGVHTWLRFAAKTEQPAIFVLNDDGTESLLNFDMQGDDVVIHRVVHQLMVRRGRLTGRVVNKLFDGSGDRLKSGTVSPAIERVGEGRQP
jgi:type IV secretion system protein VirB9